MEQMSENKFLQFNPDAKMLAKKKLHPKLEDGIMKVYRYRDRADRYIYGFCYEGYMVFNPIFTAMEIPYKQLGLFCYEWFLEWEEITNIVEEMNDDEGLYYSCPGHINTWDFAERWVRRYSDNQMMGEGLREHTKKQVISKTTDYLRYATDEEKERFKKQMEEILYAI